MRVTKNKIKVNEIIKNEREKRGWTQAKLSQKSGLSQQVISSHESSDREHYEYHAVKKLFEVLGVQ